IGAEEQVHDAALEAVAGAPRVQAFGDADGLLGLEPGHGADGVALRQVDVRIVGDRLGRVAHGFGEPARGVGGRENHALAGPLGEWGASWGVAWRIPPRGP